MKRINKSLWKRKLEDIYFWVGYKRVMQAFYNLKIYLNNSFLKFSISWRHKKTNLIFFKTKIILKNTLKNNYKTNTHSPVALVNLDPWLLSGMVWTVRDDVDWWKRVLITYSWKWFPIAFFGSKLAMVHWQAYS